MAEEEVRLGVLDNAVGYLLRRAQLAVFEDFAKRFAALDLTPAQFSTLLTIHENPGRRQSDIAASLGVQRPNFVALMDALKMFDGPKIELHISNVHARESVYHKSLISPVVTGVMIGFGAAGYELAIEAIAVLAGKA